VVRRIFTILLAAAMVLTAACSGGTLDARRTTVSGARNFTSCPPDARLAPLEPQDGAYFGVSLDWANDNPADYAARLGRRPSVYVEFASFPLDRAGMDHLAQTATAVLAEKGMLLVTLEPLEGLETVTVRSAEDLARSLDGYNRQGLPTLVRFAHEMNGSWYSWSQKPVSYKKAFRAVAGAVHRLAPGSAMLWAPNYAGGYPYEGGRYGAKPGSADFVALDTDEDGRLTMADDPYDPYYPGDEAVDWVGMSLYHWGDTYPWGENEAPEPGKFAALLTGDYRGANGDEREVPDFYDRYALGHGKPLAITETAAFFAPGGLGVDARVIKEQWWNQVFDPETATRFPRLKMINWFEWSKHEAEVDARVDWTATRNPELASAFRQALPAGYRFAGDQGCIGKR